MGEECGECICVCWTSDRRSHWSRYWPRSECRWARSPDPPRCSPLVRCCPLARPVSSVSSSCGPACPVSSDRFLSCYDHQVADLLFLGLSFQRIELQIVFFFFIFIENGLNWIWWDCMFREKIEWLANPNCTKCNYSRKCTLKYMLIVSSIFELFSKL